MSLFSVTPQGVITVDTADVRADFETAYKAALGADLNLDTSTPGGQLVVNDTTMLTTAMAECVAMANETNVIYATGEALDVAAAFYGFYRKTSTPTVVVATLVGTTGTTIAAGALASDGTNEYALLNTVTIPSTGSVAAEFACTTMGAILCPPQTLTQIKTTVAGWDSITNQYAGVPGTATESDNAFRDRVTANTLNKRGRAMMGAILDNIGAINGVVSVNGAENPSGETQTIDGVSMPAHSIFVTVLGGGANEVAQVLSQQKTMGAETVGDTSVSYVDSEIDFQYTYKIFRPVPVSIYVRVEYAPNAFTPTNVGDQITELIQSYISANPFKIGQTISGGTLAAALSGYGKINLLAIKVSTNGSNWVDYIATTKRQIGILNTITVVTN